jgi:demethylmenaquinone methyltransferase/2-methoxy-6-polyprenyl-1,4-benzoquinol methylase
MRALQEIGPVHTALELACGTGIWTRELAQIADKIVALDSSTEVLAINSGKLDSPKIHYWQTDLFQWEPTEQYDLVLFTFWLSHVPPELLDEFLSKVYRAVKPGGSCFLVDSRHEPNSTAKDMPLNEEEHIVRTRKLNDGTIYKVIKVFYEPEELSASLAKAGFTPTVTTTANYFIFARGVK